MEPTKKTTISTKIKMKEELLIPEKELSEPGEQFKKIFDEFHNPKRMEEKRCLDNRKKWAENIASDAGL